MEQVRDAGLVGEFHVFARNSLCLFVRKERVGDINNLADIGRSDVRTMVAPAESDPGGAYTVELIERGNIMVAGTGRPMPELIASGEVDAIILYQSLAVRFPDFEVVPLPPKLNMSDHIVFPVGAIVREGRTHPQGDTFISLLRGGAGQDLLERNGFLPG
jgi:ABC-type molybdate transport system substrate-binding protein